MNEETKKETNTAAKDKTMVLGGLPRRTAGPAGRKPHALRRSGQKGTSVCIGAAVLLALFLALGCGGTKEESSGHGGNAAAGNATEHSSSLLDKASIKTREDGNVNFYGFYTGMPTKDAEVLATYYGLPSLGEGAFRFKETPISHKVYDIQFNLKAVQRLSGGGNSYKELATTISLEVAPLDWDIQNDTYRYKTIGGVQLYLGDWNWRNPEYSGGGLLYIKDDSLAKQAQQEEAELEFQSEKAEVDSISQQLRAADTRRAGEMTTIALPGGAEMEMVWCPPGAFIMGSPENEEGRNPNEIEHRVTLTDGFWMARTEVTQAQWTSVMGGNPSTVPGDDLPVVNVSWNECQVFCGKSGLKLSSEAQWEYACRAGSLGAFGGTGQLDEMGWYLDNSGNTIHPVGQKNPNAWGLLDMHGNVVEWCEDNALKYSQQSATNPVLKGSGSQRMCRGGTFLGNAALCRSAKRLFFDCETSEKEIGFRPVCFDLDEQRRATETSEKESADKQSLQQAVAALGVGKQAGETRTIPLPKGETMDLVWCPPGIFTMGSPTDEEGRFDDGEWFPAGKGHPRENQHRVKLTSGFWMAKTEVTQAQWESVMGNNPSEFKGGNLPVESVTWDACLQFCQKTGLELPTEAQWEYACRAGSSGPFAGTGRLGDMGWYEENSKRGTKPVGKKKPNAWGLYDMHGNVAEWCSDWFAETLSGAVVNPKGPETGEGRVCRGGHWYDIEDNCRSACRNYSSQARQGIGFRPCFTSAGP
jgi:formylglycine-generating enzyme required for sulfatase activity